MSDKATLKPYKLQRHKIQTGDVYGTASPELFSGAIREITRSQISHVGMFIVLGDGIFIAEAMIGKGVRFMRASTRFKKENFVLLRGGETDMKLVWDDIGTVEYGLIDALIAPFINSVSKQTYCSNSLKRWKHLDFSHLKRGVFPSDIVSALTVV